MRPPASLTLSMNPGNLSRPYERLSVLIALRCLGPVPLVVHLTRESDRSCPRPTHCPAMQNELGMPTGLAVKFCKVRSMPGRSFSARIYLCLFSLRLRLLFSSGLPECDSLLDLDFGQWYLLVNHRASDLDCHPWDELLVADAGLAAISTSNRTMSHSEMPSPEVPTKPNYAKSAVFYNRCAKTDCNGV